MAEVGSPKNSILLLWKGEFFFRFTVPLSVSKWDSRLKCNLYYYRTNYFIMILFILGMGFLRRPLAVVAALMTALSIAFLNDSFAGTFSEKVTRTVRQFSPHLAAKMRHPLYISLLFLGVHLPKEQSIYVDNLVGYLFFYWYGTVTLSHTVTVAHASFRVPNLKARLNTFCEEFCAVWRNHSEL